MSLLPIAFAATVDCSLWPQLEKHAKNILQAEKNNKFYPQPNLYSSVEAYLIQACIVRKKGRKIIGFKAGLTSKQAQQKFNMSSPVFGVFVDGNKLSKHEFEVEQLQHLIEVELAFRLKRDIDNLNSLQEPISNYVDAVAPAIEIPAYYFANESTLTGYDIIAANVGANKFLVGNFLAIDRINVNTILIELLYENESKHTGRSNIPFNDQWKALKWLLTQALVQGYTLKKNQILLTGALFPPKHLERGHYRVEFSELGTLKFEAR